MASLHFNFDILGFDPATATPGAMYFDGTDLVMIDPSGMPRKICNNVTAKYHYPKQTKEIVAWCPECTKEYQLPELVESYYCYHCMASEELHKITPEEIRSIEDFVPVKKIECLIFEIVSEPYQLY